jgi:hypothetical protein
MAENTGGGKDRKGNIEEAEKPLNQKTGECETASGLQDFMNVNAGKPAIR